MKSLKNVTNNFYNITHMQKTIGFTIIFPRDTIKLTIY